MENDTGKISVEALRHPRGKECW